MAQLEDLAAQVDWFRRTGHCGACGQPGNYCLCRQPCACSHLHDFGSGLTADAADVFAAPAPGQEGLF